MNDKKFTIPPNKWVLLLFTVLFVVGSAIFFVEYDGIIDDDSRDVLFLMILIAIIIIDSIKRYDFTYEGISVQYIPIFMTRQVDISRIRNINFVKWGGNQYIVILLDGCPSLNKDIKYIGYIGWFAFLHPVKTVCIKYLSDKELVKYQNMIRELYPNVKTEIIDKDYKW